MAVASIVVGRRAAVLIACLLIGLARCVAIAGQLAVRVTSPRRRLLGLGHHRRRSRAIRRRAAGHSRDWWRAVRRMGVRLAAATSDRSAGGRVGVRARAPPLDGVQRSARPDPPRRRAVRCRCGGGLARRFAAVPNVVASAHRVARSRRVGDGSRRRSAVHRFGDRRRCARVAGDDRRVPLVGALSSDCRVR